MRACFRLHLRKLTQFLLSSFCTCVGTFLHFWGRRVKKVLPDQIFHNFWAPQSFDWRILCSPETAINVYKVLYVRSGNPCSYVPDVVVEGNRNAPCGLRIKVIKQFSGGRRIDLKGFQLIHLASSPPPFFTWKKGISLTINRFWGAGTWLKITSWVLYWIGWKFLLSGSELVLP